MTAWKNQPDLFLDIDHAFTQNAASISTVTYIQVIHVILIRQVWNFNAPLVLDSTFGCSCERKQHKLGIEE